MGFAWSLLSVSILSAVGGFFAGKYVFELDYTNSLICGLILSIVALYAEIILYMLKMYKLDKKEAR